MKVYLLFEQVSDQYNIKRVHSVYTTQETAEKVRGLLNSRFNTRCFIEEFELFETVAQVVGLR